MLFPPKIKTTIATTRLFFVVSLTALICLFTYQIATGSDLSLAQSNSKAPEGAPRVIWDKGYPTFVNHLIFKKKTLLEKDWAYKAQITIDASTIDESLSNFPILIDHSVLPQALLDGDGAQAAKSDGGDIRFSTKKNGSEPLPCEIVSINLDNDPAASTAEIWVRLPTISATNDTTLYVWWGNGSSSQPAATDLLGGQAVWSNGYAAVYHMEGSYSGITDEVFDSSPNGNHGTGRVTFSTDPVTGKIGGAQQWAQAGDALIVPHDTSLIGMDELTVSMWLYRNTRGIGNKWGRYLWKNDSYGFNGYYDNGHEIFFNTFHGGTLSPSGSPEFSNCNNHWLYIANSWAGAANTNNYILIRSNSTADEIHVFTNDSLDIRIGSVIVGSADIIIGNRVDFVNTPFNRTLDGIIDELRIQSKARSNGWIKAEYNNVHNIATFFKATGPVLPGS